MKIIWTEKGLRVLHIVMRVVFTLAITAACLAVLLVLGGVGEGDYPGVTDTSHSITKIVIGVIAFIAASFISGLASMMNEAIDDELRRRYERKRKLHEERQKNQRRGQNYNRPL